MHTAAYRANVRKLVLLAVLAALAALAYLLVEVSLEHTRLFQYAMKLRLPKLAAMVITACSIGGASIVFPCIPWSTPQWSFSPARAACWPGAPIWPSPPIFSSWGSWPP